MKTYKIVRKYMEQEDEEVETGLTLEEALAYCLDPETSSKTCTSLEGMTRTHEMGEWMDVYYEEE